MKQWGLTILIFGLPCLNAFSQQATTTALVNYNYLPALGSKAPVQKDMMDVLHKVIHRKTRPEERPNTGKVFISLVPAAGYSLSSGFAGLISGNAAFYASKQPMQNISTFYSSISYSTYSQKVLNIASSVWTAGNKNHLTGEWRYIVYPQQTFGLGSLTTTATADLINYSYIRFYETFLREVATDFYIGGGYNLDDHFNIQENGNKDGSVSDFQKYGLTTQSVSSGLNLTLLWDNRRNSINPSGGDYLNLVYRNNNRLLKSDADWQSLLIDWRKYLKLSAASSNVLAFWGLSWFTFGGKAPYLDLPSTGWDGQGNTGRGYIQSRFRGTNMLYLETEYRFGVTANGLIGGVAFVNTETFSGFPNPQFQQLIPGAGAGIRIKLNKYSNTNVCLDYGIGTNGSRGWFVNLGEVF